MHNMKKQALISCSDKSGVVEFAKALTELGYHILSTGGTAKLIAQAGIPVQEVADYTGFPEMLDGRSMPAFLPAAPLRSTWRR